MPERVSFDGTVRVEGELDLADAFDVQDAVTRGAETLRAAGSTQSRNVRRSMAVGELARHQLALDLQPADDEDTDGSANKTMDKTKARKKPRQVIL